MQVEVTRKQSRPPKCVPFSSTCQMIAKLLMKCSDVILQHWFKGIEVNSLGFFCDCCRKQDNPDHDQQCFVSIPPNSTTQDVLMCARHKLLRLTTQHHYWLKVAKVYLFSQNVLPALRMYMFQADKNSPLKKIEFTQLAQAVQSQERLIKLAEALEMDSSKYPSVSSNSGIKMLRDWSANMKQHGIDREFQRFHLVHHLHSIGMISTANE